MIFASKSEERRMAKQREAQPPVRVFVYGSLRRGEYNHPDNFKDFHVVDGIIKDVQLVGGNGYPWLLDGNSSVIGEVYDLPPNTFAWIEAMEVGAGYVRRPVLVYPDNDATPALSAEAYYYATPHELDTYPRVASGDWTKRDTDEEPIGTN